MVTETSHKLKCKSSSGEIYEIHTHKEKQYGDIGIRTADGQIVYVSTSPENPFIPKDQTISPIHVKFPQDSYPNCHRLVSVITRPDAITINERFMLSNWKQGGTGTYFYARASTSDSGSRVTYTVGVRFNDSSLKQITRVSVFLWNRKQNGQRLPCKIAVKPANSGTIEAVHRVNTHDLNRSGSYTEFIFSGNPPNWNIQRLVNGAYWTVTSVNDYLK